MPYVITEKDKNLGLSVHLLSFVGYVIPFGHILGPLILWLVKKEESAFLKFHGKEVLNFQISMTIWIIISVFLIFVFIGFLTTPILILTEIVCTIIGAVKASKGEEYYYPLSIEFIK